jgi:hypothetical protein
VSWTTPGFWDDISSVGLAILACSLFILALVRGWVVIGKYHREVVTRLDARAEKDTETIALLSRAVTERAAEDQAMTRILNAIRTASSDKGGVT